MYGEDPSDEEDENYHTPASESWCWDWRTSGAVRPDVVPDVPSPTDAQEAQSEDAAALVATSVLIQDYYSKLRDYYLNCFNMVT